LYYRHVQKKIKQIKQSPSLTADMKSFMLARTGGVNKWAIVGLFVFYLFISALFIEEEGSISNTTWESSFSFLEEDFVAIVQTDDLGITLEEMYKDIEWGQDGNTVMFSGVNRQNDEKAEITFFIEEISFEEYEIYVEEIFINDRILSDFEVDEFMRWLLGEGWMEEDLFKDNQMPSIVM
jgi:hypothetical protein